jgi:predicted unusual protein kinase regulating ubiquinone biosynthesis (AarF/ABC1/UbiB family)
MDSLGRNNPLGDRHPPRFYSSRTYRPSAVSVDLKGRGRAGKVRRAVKDGFKRRADVLDVFEDSPVLVGVETVEISDETRPGAKPQKQLLLPSPRDPKEVDSAVGPPMMSLTVFKAGYFKTISRLFVYLGATLQWYTQRFWDKFRRRDTDERRAVRLREIIEGLGGTAVKIGQQMSMRIDLMPYVYGVELSKMLDKFPPFETEYAVERIKEATGGRPIDETFSEFNPEPIGSASVACVYKAVLQTGETVAVKVRRPGIGELFVADCRALAWVLRVLEFLTLIRSGLTSNFIFEFRTMLLEELDFVKEARHTELFRRRAHKKLHRVTTPKIYFDLSGDDVLVQEFVTGVWLGDMIAYVEQKDEVALQQLRRLNIDPEKIAKKLIRVNQFGVFENLLFHADPHPSNILVRPDNKLIFIDFGAIGAYTTRERANWSQLNYYHHREDVGRMVQAAMAILEPLPPIDLDEFSKRLEKVFWQDIYAFKSKHSQWYEHTSARIWMSLLGLAREYNVPMNLNTLRMIRSTLLSETVAARLYPKIDAWREHRKYNKAAAKRSRKRVLRSISKRLCGPRDTDYQRIEQLAGIANRAIYFVQRCLDTPLYRYGMLVKKVAYAIALMLRAVLSFVMIALGGLIISISLEIYKRAAYKSWETFTSYTNEPFIRNNFDYLFLRSRWSLLFWAAVLISLFLNTRRTLMRLWDKEIRRNNTSGLS